MKRICLLTTSFPRYPDDEASVFLQRLVEAYSEAEANGIVIVPRDRDEAAHSMCGRFKIYRFGYGVFRRGALAFGAGIMPNLRRHPSLILQAPMLLLQLTMQAFRRRGEYDVVHANWALALLAAWVNCLLTGKPFVVTLRSEDIPLMQKPLLRCLCNAALRKASKILSVNQQFVSDIVRLAGVAPQKCEVIPNGVSITSADPEKAAELLTSRGIKAGKYLLFIGTVIPRKRIEVLIRALALPGLTELQLVLCGRLDETVYVDSLRQIATQSGVSERVKFEGAVAPSKIPLYLKGAAFYVSASSFEGRPNALLEAFAAGKASAVSNIPAHAEIVRHGENGILFDAENPADLEAVLTSLRASQARIQALEAAALNSVKNQSWQACAQQYINIFNML